MELLDKQLMHAEILNNTRNVYIEMVSDLCHPMTLDEELKCGEKILELGRKLNAVREEMKNNFNK